MTPRLRFRNLVGGRLTRRARIRRRTLSPSIEVDYRQTLGLTGHPRFLRSGSIKHVPLPLIIGFRQRQTITCASTRSREAQKNNSRLSVLLVLVTYSSSFSAPLRHAILGETAIKWVSRNGRQQCAPLRTAHADSRIAESLTLMIILRSPTSVPISPGRQVRPATRSHHRSSILIRDVAYQKCPMFSANSGSR